MGKVTVRIKLTNLADLILRDAKVLKVKPRTVEAEGRISRFTVRKS